MRKAIFITLVVLILAQCTSIPTPPDSIGPDYGPFGKATRAVSSAEFKVDTTLSAKIVPSKLGAEFAISPPEAPVFADKPAKVTVWVEDDYIWSKGYLAIMPDKYVPIYFNETKSGDSYRGFFKGHATVDLSFSQLVNREIRFLAYSCSKKPEGGFDCHGDPENPTKKMYQWNTINLFSADCNPGEDSCKNDVASDGSEQNFAMHCGDDYKWKEEQCGPYPCLISGPPGDAEMQAAVMPIAGCAECEPNQVECDGDYLVTCSANGLRTKEECPSSTSCIDGACVEPDVEENEDVIEEPIEEPGAEPIFPGIGVNDMFRKWYDFSIKTGEPRKLPMGPVLYVNPYEESHGIKRVKIEIVNPLTGDRRSEEFTTNIVAAIPYNRLLSVKIRLKDVTNDGVKLSIQFYKPLVQRMYGYPGSEPVKFQVGDRLDFGIGEMTVNYYDSSCPNNYYDHLDEDMIDEYTRNMECGFVGVTLMKSRFEKEYETQQLRFGLPVQFDSMPEYVLGPIRKRNEMFYIRAEKAPSPGPSKTVTADGVFEISSNDILIALGKKWRFETLISDNYFEADTYSHPVQDYAVDAFTQDQWGSEVGMRNHNRMLRHKCANHVFGGDDKCQRIIAHYFIIDDLGELRGFMYLHTPKEVGVNYMLDFKDYIPIGVNKDFEFSGLYVDQFNKLQVELCELEDAVGGGSAGTCNKYSLGEMFMIGDKEYILHDVDYNKERGVYIEYADALQYIPEAGSTKPAFMSRV